MSVPEKIIDTVFKNWKVKSKWHLEEYESETELDNFCN